MKLLKIFCIFFALCLLLETRATAEKRSMHIIWLMHKDHDFWHLNQKIATDAAKDLNVSVSFIYTVDNDRFSTAKVVLDALEALKKAPDTEYFMAMIGNFPLAEKVLQKAEELKIPVFLYNSGLEESFKPRLGVARNILGALIPDDRNAAYLEAKYLIKTARAQNSAASSAPVRVIGLGGMSRDTVDTERRLGLEQAIKEENAVLDQYFYTRWSVDVAKDAVIRARKRYPEALVFWSIADYLAIASLKALKEENTAILFGGIDWTVDALNSLQEGGGLSASVGGHFLDPGWVTVLLYDYFNGQDFKQYKSDCLMQSSMSILDRDSVKILIKKFPNYDWTRIDFKKFSRVESQSKHYDFSLDALLKM